MNAVLTESENNGSVSLVWETICNIDELVPNIGARALLGDTQIALFKVDDNVYAIDAYDPFSEAAVLSRGIVGDLKSEIVVASPIYKQHFSLKTGICIEDPSVNVKAYAVRVVDNMVQLGYEPKD